jgi:hypothetical protein
MIRPTLGHDLPKKITNPRNFVWNNFKWQNKAMVRNACAPPTNLTQSKSNKNNAQK